MNCFKAFALCIIKQFSLIDLNKCYNIGKIDKFLKFINIRGFFLSEINNQGTIRSTIESYPLNYWKKLNSLVIIISNLILLFLLVKPFFSIDSIDNALYLLQLYGFLPILFILIIIEYNFKLISWLFKKNFFDNIIAKYLSIKSLTVFISITSIYTLFLGL